MKFNYINKIRNIEANPAVTIYMNTNRTYPDNSKDAINLKNLVTEVEKRLNSEYGKKETILISNKLKEFTSEINHNYNLDSLIIFVSSNFFEYLRLPVKVKDNVIIGKNFATKVLIRSMLQTENYYILCLSRKTIRLIEAVNDSVVSEINDDIFPIKNESYIDSEDIKRAWASSYDNLIKEFFNKADKHLVDYYKKNPKPVILAGDSRNISYYNEIADKKSIIIGYIEGNYDNTKANEIAKQTYTVIEKLLKEKQDNAIKEIELALKEQKLLTDLSDIYRAVRAGNGFKLFVEKNYFQPAVIENDLLIIKDNPSESGVIDDIVNEIINLVILKGGDILFLDSNKLNNNIKLALITRY